MKKNISDKSNYRILFVFLVLFAMFSSCTKESDKTSKTEQPGGDAAEFTETNEDLLSVDYKEFYSELSSGGEWIEISAKDLGIKIDTGKLSCIYKDNNEFAASVFGIKSAYAQTDAELFNLFVWRPATELLNKEIKESGEEPPPYVPYNNGQWLYTDEGWYFKGETPQKEITSHYGRWAQDPNLGYVWLPGKTFSPAWVEWRENTDYVAWAPIPPGTYIENDAVNVPAANEDRFTVVEKKNFTEPSVSKYRYQTVENKNKIMIKEMTKKDGVMIKNKTVINKGPDVSDIEKSSGKKIETVKVKKYDKKENVVSSKNEVGVFTPQFKKTKDVKKEPVSKPEKLVSYKDAKKITKEEKQEMKQEDKEQKKEEKELKKEEKEIKKEQKKEDKEIKKEEKKEQKEIKKEQKKEDKDVKKDDKEDKGKKNKNDDENGKDKKGKK
jgi:hypothetical protein